MLPSSDKSLLLQWRSASDRQALQRLDLPCQEPTPPSHRSNHRLADDLYRQIRYDRSASRGGQESPGQLRPATSSLDLRLRRMRSVPDDRQPVPLVSTARILRLVVSADPDNLV